jgi:hypothetical protein
VSPIGVVCIFVPILFTGAGIIPVVPVFPEIPAFGFPFVLAIFQPLLILQIKEIDRSSSEQFAAYVQEITF